ncbi:nestin [Ranitomeya variabilis]|uniref:nestin n=1 Tax=Ranitomeya variabilis TaxID=490064 RepID=UPI004055F92B
MSRMETYPTSISVGEESAQMWSLNKRLEAYLYRVKALEEENNLLRAEIHHLKNTRSDKSFIRKYHDEIMTLRDALDDGHREMVQMETDRDSIYQEIEYVKELCLEEKQAQEDVKRELSESKRLLEEEKRAQIWLKERLFQLEQEMEDIFNAHEEEKVLMEKEISSYSQRLENFKIAPINFKPVNVEDYANQLSHIWQGAVEEYKNKVSTLEANFSQAKENLKKVVDENKQSQLQLQNLDGDLESLKNRKEMLEGLLTKQWLEQQDEEGRLQLEIETLEKKKQDLRIQIAQVLEDRQQLMHLKMSLSLEVATYRSLLEAESTRLYSPGMDYKMSSSISDIQLEQNAFRKSHYGNTEQLISKDNRLSSSKKQSAETPSKKRYLNVKSTSTANRTSPVTKEFQKVSSVLQSQGLKYTKTNFAKTATTTPSIESNLKRNPQKADIFKKNQEETITCSSKSVTKETLAKDTNIQFFANGNTSNTNNKALKEIEHMVEFLPLIEKEIVSAQVESSLKTEGKHIEVNSKFGFEKQNNVVEDQNKYNDTLIVEKTSKENIDFEAPLSLDEGFGNINKQHIMEKQEVFGQTVTCERLYDEKEELVKSLVHQNIETPIKVNNEEFRKVLDFSKTNTKDMNETNEPTSDGTPDLDIEYSHSQELEFDNQVSLNNADVDKEVTNHLVHEQKEINKDFQLEESLSCAEATLQYQEVGVVQNLQVLSCSTEDNTSLPDDGQNFTKNIYDEQKSAIEQYHVHPKKDTEQVTQNTKIQEYDNEIDQQSYNQVEEILEVDSQEKTQFDFKTKDKFKVPDVCESSSHLSKDNDCREENKKQEIEDFEEDCKYEETIISAEENIHDSTNVKQTRILVVKEVYQSSEQVMDDLEETLLVSQEEKNNFEFSDLKQILQCYGNQQKTEIVEATEEITQNITDINTEESEDQKDNVQKERNQLSQNSLHPGLADFKTMSDTEQECQLENKNIVQTLDGEEGDSMLDILSNSKQEDLYEIVHEEQPLNVQSTPEHEIQSSESEGLDRNGQPLENNLIEEGNIHTCLSELKNSELNDSEEDNKDVIEENYVDCTAVGFMKAIKTEVCVQEEYNIAEKAQEIMTQECQLLKYETNVILDEVAGNVLEEKNSFHQEEQESQKDFPQVEEEGKESYHQEIKQGQEGYHQKEEGQEDNLQKVKEGQEHYHQEVMPELYHQEVKEEQESYHHEEEKQKDDHQMEDQMGCEVISTLIEPVLSEEDNKSNYSFKKDSNEEQFVGISLNIIPNNLRFSSENDAEAQAEQHEQNSKFAHKEIKTQKEEKNDLEVECENFKQNSDGIILEEKEKEQEIFDTEIICQQSTFLLEHQCENVIEDSKSRMYLVKNITEKYDFDGSIEKRLTELDAMDAAGDLDYDHSKSEYSMDSQDISICSQKSEECEISKEYQLEQTLPDTTPLPNLDEFEDLAEDEIITALEASAEVTKTQSLDDGEAEDTLHSSLESQSSQILSKVSEQSILFKDDDKDADYTEKQDENPKDLRENENTEHVAKTKLDTENSSATGDTVNISAELSQDLVDSKIYDAKSKFEELRISQGEGEASKDPLLEKTQSETSSEDQVQVQLSSKQLSHESVDGDHSEESEDRRQTLSEYTNVKNVLPETFDFVLSSKHSETELVSDPSHDDTIENEEHISKEHSDLVPQDFGLEQKQTIDMEEHERDFCKNDTISLPNLDDESENLEDVKLILATEQATELTKLQIPVDGGEAEVVLDSSLESQSSLIFPEVSEQSNLRENNGNDYDYHEQEAESPQDLLESVNPGNFVRPKLNTENCSEDKVERKINEETFETEDFTTSQEEVEVVSLKVDDYEISKDSELGETQFVTSSSQDQVIVSSKQLANKIVEEEYNEEPKERIITLSEDEISENVIAITLDLAPPSKHSEVELIYVSSHDDTKENEEYKTKEHSGLVTEDFGLEQAKNIDSDDQTRNIPKENITQWQNFNDKSENLGDELILATESPANKGEAKPVFERNYGSQLSQNITEVSEQSNLFKDEDYNEQGESLIELPENKNPDLFEEPKLEAEICSETVDTKESTIGLSGNLDESKLDDENSEESTTSQEKVDIFSVKVDEFEESKDSQLWNIKFETIASEDQVKLLSEKLVSEIVDEDNNEEHDERRIIFSEDTKNISTKTLDFVPSSERSESELVPDPYLDDKKEDKEHIMKEHSDFLTQDFKSKQIESVATEDHGEFYKKDITTLPNPENEFENLENNDILVSEQSAAVAKTQITDNEGEVEDVLDSSVESQSSQVLPEVSEQSILFKDDDIDSNDNEQQDDNPKDRLESEDTEHVVETKLDAEDSSITPDTKNPPNEQSEDSLDNNIDEEKFESEEPITSGEEVADFSPNDDEFEVRNDSQLEKTKLEKTSSEDKVQQSSEQLVSEGVDDEDQNKKPEGRGLIDTYREEELSETYDFIPSSEHSEMELVSAPCLEEKEEHIMKEHSDFIKQDFIPKQTESRIIKDHERDFCKKNTTPLTNPHDEFKNLESNEILASKQSAEVIKLQSSDDIDDADEVLDSSVESQSSQVLPKASEHSILFKDDIDSNYNEVDCPKDVLERENREHVGETKLDTEDASVTLDTEKPSAELSENPVNSKMENEKYESDEPTNSSEVVAFSPKDDEFEVRKDSQLEKTQFEISSEDQLQLSLEQLDNQRVDEDHNEESEVIGLTVCGDTSKEEGITKISSEHSEMELIPSPCLEDTKESEEHIMKEHSNFVTQDFKSNQTENINTEDHEVDFCEEDTTSLPNLEEEFEILETDEILASEWSAEVTQLQNPCESGEADEALDSSLESQSSQIFPEASEHSISFKDEDKDSDYKQGDIPKDLLESDNPEYFVEAKLDTEGSSAILDTEKTLVEPCEDPVGSKVDDEKSEKPTTSQKQVAVFPPKVDEFEGNKDSLLEPTQFESSSENQVQLFSEQLDSQSVNKHHKEEPEERMLMLSEITNTENVLTKTLDFVPSSEQSETDLVSVPCHEDIKHSELVAQYFGLKQTESIDWAGNFCTEETKPLSIPANKNLEDDEIIISSQQSAEITKLQSPTDDCEAEEVLDSSLKSHSSQIFPIVSEQSILFKDDDTVSDYNEQQGESPKDLLENENPEQFVEPKLETKHSSARLETEEPAAELSEYPEESKIVHEKFESDEPTTSQEQIAGFLPKVDKFEESKDSTLENTQFETTSSEDQVQQSPEQPVSENVGEDHNEELEERRLTLNEGTNTEIKLAEIIYSVPSSEHSETEFVPAPGHDDTKEEEEHIMKEHFDLVTQDFILEKKQSVKTEECEKEFFKKDEIPLPNLDEESENLKDDEITLASAQSAEVTKSQSPDDGETEELLDSSLASQSSEVLPEVTEQSTLYKDEDIVLGYSEQQGERPKDLLENENPEQFVEPKLETEHSSARLETEEPAAELSEYPEENKIVDEKFKSEEPTTSQEKIAVFLPKVDELEESKDSTLEKTQFETASSEDQVQQSSEQPVSENVGEDHNEELEERRLTLNEGSNTEIKLAEIIYSVPSSEHSETEFVPAPGHEDTKEKEEYIMKEHFNLVTQDFIQEKKESVKTEDCEKEFFKKDATPMPNLDDESENLKDDEIILASEQSAEVTESQSPEDGETEEVLDGSLASQSPGVLPEVNEQSTLYKDEDIVLGCNEQQGESLKDLLESEMSQQFVEPKLETKDSSATLDAEEPAAQLSEHSVENKMDAEKSNSEEPTTSQVEAAILSLKQEKLETSKDSHLEQNQTEISPPKNQVQLSSEQMVSESADEEHEEESKEESLTLDEDTNTDIVLIETEFVLSSEHSRTELFPALSHEDKTENEDYTKKERSNLVKQDFELEKTESIDTEDNEIDVCKEDYMQCDVDLIDSSTKEPSTKSLDDYNKDTIIASNVPDIPKIKSELQVGMTLGTIQDYVKVDVKPSGESSKNDESVTSDESSPNVSTMSYAHEQQDSSDTDSKISKQAEQSDPLLTPEPVPEGSFMEQRELQTPSDEEKDVLSERSDSSFDSSKEHEDISEFTREYNENEKTMNGIFGHTIVQATLDFDNHMFYGHSTKEDHEIIISEAKTFVGLDGGLVNPQSPDKNKDTVIEFTTSERKSEGLFQSLFETSEHKESHLDEASAIKNKTDSSAEQSQYTNKLINPYISEKDLDDPTKITSSVMDECLINTNQEVNEANQGLRISQQEDSWSSDE